MGFFRPSRTARAGRWFEWKVRVFFLGAGLGLIGMFLDDHRVVTAALGVLAVGVILRMLPDGSAVEKLADDEDEEGDEDDAPAAAVPEPADPADPAEDVVGRGTAEER